MRRWGCLCAAILGLGLCAAWALTWRAAEQRAVRLACEHMGQVVGAEAVARARVEAHPARCGWVVIFRDADARCDSGAPFWPGACRYGPNVYRDVYACVETDGWRIRQVGSGVEYALEPGDLCAGLAPDGATVAPTAEPQAAP